MMAPRLIFWETTRACNLACPHCRASAIKSRLPEELTTQEAKDFINSAASFSKPIFVFSGGEALLRDDIFELIRYANNAGLKCTMASNGSLITLEIAHQLKENGIRLAAVSIYGSGSDVHDGFCGQKGAFERSLAGIQNLKSAGVALQINTTITKRNLSELEAIGRFALEQGAVSYHVFFLVPVGRGKAIKGDEITPQEYEDAFNRLYDFKSRFPIHIKPTCAPHYYRVTRQRGVKDNLNNLRNPARQSLRGAQRRSNPHGDCFALRARNDSFDGLNRHSSAFHEMTKGCLAGQGVCFVSYQGEVFGCGYLPVKAGDLRQQDFKTIWDESELFKALRDDTKLQGKCGICEFKKVCGGCRARAYAAKGDYLEEEPYCIYEPISKKAIAAL